MKNKQKGFVIPLVIAIIILLGIGGGTYLYINKKSDNLDTSKATIDDSKGKGTSTSIADISTSDDVDKNNSSQHQVKINNPAVNEVVTSTNKIQPSIVLTNPNKEEVWKIGSKQSIGWKINGNVPKGYNMTIKLGDNFVGSISAKEGAGPSSSNYTLTIPESVFNGDQSSTFMPGKYKITVSLFDGDINLGNGNPNYKWGKVIAQDSSSFDIYIASSTSFNEQEVVKCVNNYQSQQNKYPNQYTKGEVVVFFATSASLAEDKKIISSYGLTSREPVGLFHSKLYVDVVVGEEFLWACRLKQDNRIEYADPNVGATTTQ